MPLYKRVGACRLHNLRFFFIAERGERSDSPVKMYIVHKRCSHQRKMESMHSILANAFLYTVVSKHIPYVRSIFDQLRFVLVLHHSPHLRFVFILILWVLWFTLLSLHFNFLFIALDSPAPTHIRVYMYAHELQFQFPLWMPHLKRTPRTFRICAGYLRHTVCEWKSLPSTLWNWLYRPQLLRICLNSMKVFNVEAPLNTSIKCKLKYF